MHVHAGFLAAWSDAEKPRDGNLLYGTAVKGSEHAILVKGIGYREERLAKGAG